MYAKIQNTIKMLLQFKHSKLRQILHADKTGFLRPSHKYGVIISCFNIKTDQSSEGAIIVQKSPVYTVIVPLQCRQDCL